MAWTRNALWGLVTVIGLGAVIQLVPYGRADSNPQVRQEPRWDSIRTRDLARRACFDCHSNQTEWPWYANIAPISWLIQRDVEEGRHVLNYSEWDRPQEEAAESAESVRKGEMPPWYYTGLQSKARLSAPDREALIRGLAATFGRDDDSEVEGTRGRRRSGR